MNVRFRGITDIQLNRARLAKDGHDWRLAQELLTNFETTLAAHIADRDRICAELAAME
jgi:hypothetical protein